MDYYRAELMRIIFILLVFLSIQCEAQMFLAPVEFDSDYEAIYAAYQSAGANIRTREMVAQNQLVKDWKASGAWTKRDMIEVEYNGVVLDWKNLSRTIQKISSPSSVAYQGFYWNGTSSYVRTGFNPSTDGVNYTLNSASMSIYIAKPSDPSVTAVEIGCMTTPFTQINTASAFFILNSAAPSTFTIAPSLRWGWFTVDRNASNSVLSYRNGVQINSQTTTSTSIPNAELFWGARSNSGTAAGFSSAISKIVAAGGSIRAEQLAEYEAIERYINNSKPKIDLSAPYTIGKYGQSNANGKAAEAQIAADLVSDISTNHEFYGTPVTNQWTDGDWDVQQVGVLQSGLFGFERRLLKSLSAYYSGEDLWLLNCGHDGSSLIQSWQKNPAIGTTYYLAQDKHDFAMAKIPMVAPMKFVIWAQGEADGNNAAWWPEYETRMADFIFRMRADYNLPNLVFILVSLSSTQTDVNATGIAAVNLAMQTCADNIPNVYYISQNSASDGTHYTAAGFETMAPLIYNVIISLN